MQHTEVSSREGNQRIRELDNHAVDQSANLEGVALGILELVEASVAMVVVERPCVCSLLLLLLLLLPPFFLLFEVINN